MIPNSQLLTGSQPRFSILPDYEHKAFIPYTGVFAASPNKELHSIIQAKVISLQPKELTLDREWQGSKQIPFEYLVAATGTRLAAPGTMPSYEKPQAVDYLKQHNQGIKKSNSIIIIGGGAVGVQSKCLRSPSSSSPFAGAWQFLFLCDLGMSRRIYAAETQGYIYHLAILKL